ncbi:MAG TPA: ATP-binding cassette domain-containing protein, partial [Gemmatimonadales bacterium]|nr:ATP-binding cassette domain-containing protein [Gemmatimonadales bacterium]
MTAAAIDARGLGKDFGAVRALDRLDLEIRDGEFFGLLGPNGAGKTTAVHLLATLLAPSRGTARVAGHDVVREGLAVRRSIGLVFQDTTLDRDLTVGENLRFAARLWSLPDRVA